MDPLATTRPEDRMTTSSQAPSTSVSEWLQKMMPAPR